MIANISKTQTASDVESQYTESGEMTHCLPLTPEPPAYRCIEKPKPSAPCLFPLLPRPVPEVDISTIARILSEPSATFKPICTNHLGQDRNCAIIDVRINGQPMKALIDTGADLSVITTKTAKQLGVQRLNEATSSGKALGGNPVPIIGSIPVNVHVYSRKALNFVIQAVDLKMDYDVLIGTDLLELLGAFKIEVKNGSFYFKPTAPLDLSAEVHLPHAITLSANSITRVELPTSIRGIETLFTPNSFDQHIAFAHAANADGWPILEAMNTSPTVVKIPKHTRVGILTPLTVPETRSSTRQESNLSA